MKRLSVVTVLFAISLALVACGGGGSSTTPSSGTGSSAGSGGAGNGGSTIDFEADPEGHLMFTTMVATGKSGGDKIDFKNPSSTPHNVAIEDSAGRKIVETKTIAEGEISAKVELEPGTYTFFCGIPGHREGAWKAP